MKGGASSALGPQLVRNRNVQADASDAELAAMLVLVAEHHVAKEFAARLCEDLCRRRPGARSFMAASRTSATASHGWTLRQMAFRSRRGLRAAETRKDVRGCAGLFWTKRTIPPGTDGKMVGKPARQTWILVRLPGQFCFGHAFQKLSREGLAFKLG